MSLDATYSEHFSTKSISQQYSGESIQANFLSQATPLARAFEESSQFLKLNDSEFQVGAEFLNAYQSGSFDEVQTFMSCLEDPGSTKIRRVFMALTAAFAGRGIAARYEVLAGLDSSQSPYFGQFQINSLDGEHTLTVSSLDTLSCIEGPDRNKNPDDFFSI